MSLKLKNLPKPRQTHSFKECQNRQYRIYGILDNDSALADDPKQEDIWAAKNQSYKYRWFCQKDKFDRPPSRRKVLWEYFDQHRRYLQKIIYRNKEISYCHLWLDGGISEDVEQFSFGLKSMTGAKVASLFVWIKVCADLWPQPRIHCCRLWQTTKKSKAHPRNKKTSTT